MDRDLRVRVERTIKTMPIVGYEYGGKCIACGRKHSVGESYHISIPSQKRGVWIGKNHGRNSLECYSATNERPVGTARKDGLQFGIELEVNPPRVDVCHEALAYLSANHFLATSDCTVGIEFKSPLYYSASAFAKVASGIEELNKTPREQYADASRRFTTKCKEVGCHLNISTPFIRSEAGYNFIRENKRELLEALENYCLRWSPDEQKAFFGREIGGQWARSCSSTRWSADVHEAWINTQRKETNRLEFRVCKFISANQYIRLVRVFSEVCLYIEQEQTNATGAGVLRAFREALVEY